jgi:hypothetical protein
MILLVAQVTPDLFGGIEMISTGQSLSPGGTDEML